MGQYHLTVNLDRHEYLNPHELGDGLKLKEQGLSRPGGIATALHVLLAVSNGRGGGDYGTNHELSSEVVGRWGGDRVAIIGDYFQPDDLHWPDPAGDPFESAYPADLFELVEKEWTNITPMVRKYLAEGVDDYYHAFTYEGGGWMDRRFELVRRAGV